MKKLLTAAIAATMTMGAAAIVPASAQVVIFGTESGQSDAQANRQANRVENRGERRAERAAENGNYAKAAKIERRSENRADAIRDEQRDDAPVLFQIN